MKSALLTGVTGQDGSYLCELLVSKGYAVHALARRSSRDELARFNALEATGVTIHYGDLRDIASVERAILAAKPEEVYNLAAQSNVGISFKVPEETKEINYYGVGRLVQALVDYAPDARLYQASTSEMFGKTNPPQNESSPFQPVSPYAEAKLRAHQDYIVGYREKYGKHFSSGILFNHESPRRGEHFVTRKITLSLARIKHGLQDSFELGNMDALRDWGFAGDYVDAMWRMLQQEKPDDYVIATGETHTVREFLVAASNAIDMPLHFEGSGVDEIAKDRSNRVILRINPAYYRPNEVHALLGDATKAQTVLGWKPQVQFKELAEMMMRSDFDALAR